MNELFTEQFNYLLVIVIGGLGFYINEIRKYIANYSKSSLEIRQKINEAQANIEIENIKKEAERNNIIEDRKLQLQLSRNIVYDGVRLINILKSIREYCNAKDSYIKIFHNSIAKGFKNYSIRFEDARSIDLNVTEKKQSIPLSGYYKDLIKFETQDYIIATLEDEEISNQIKHTIKEFDLTKKIYFPLLEELSTTKYENVTTVIKKNDIDYVIIGLIVVCLDKESVYENEESLIDFIKQKVDEIHELYSQNNLLFS